MRLGARPSFKLHINPSTAFAPPHCLTCCRTVSRAASLSHAAALFHVLPHCLTCCLTVSRAAPMSQVLPVSRAVVLSHVFASLSHVLSYVLPHCLTCCLSHVLLCCLTCCLIVSRVSSLSHVLPCCLTRCFTVSCVASLSHVLPHVLPCCLTHCFTVSCVVSLSHVLPHVLPCCLTRCRGNVWCKGVEGGRGIFALPSCAPRCPATVVFFRLLFVIVLRHNLLAIWSM